MPRIPQGEENGCYNNLLADLIQPDIPGYRNFVRLTHAIFDLIEEYIHHLIKKEVIDLKLEMTLRHLATG